LLSKGILPISNNGENVCFHIFVVIADNAVAKIKEYD